MNAIAKILIAAVAVSAAAASSADATPSVVPGDQITVKGNAPAICVLGEWALKSGSASFSPGSTGVATFTSDQLTGTDGVSVLGAANALDFHAPLVCNTAISWSFSTTNGAFRLTSGAVPPSGFANQWLYGLSVGPYTSGGTQVGSVDSFTSSGAPQYESYGLNAGDSERIAYMDMVFTPVAQNLRMLAGNYSESITLTVSPTL
ncbi:MAG: hypothetical protein WBQ17_03385 [Rhizomicrobium sp.]